MQAKLLQLRTLPPWSPAVWLNLRTRLPLALCRQVVRQTTMPVVQAYSRHQMVWLQVRGEHLWAVFIMVQRTAGQCMHPLASPSPQ